MENAIQLYLQEVNKFNTLSEEEEKSLFLSFANGNIAAKNKIIEANLKLVISIAKLYKNTVSFSLLDLIQEGNIGLSIAVDKYDPSRGVRFSTCAAWYIKQAISRAVENKNKSIRVPSYVQETLNKIKKVERQLAIQYEREPTAEEVAQHLNLSEEDILKIQKYNSDICSLDIPVGNDEEGSLGDLIIDENNLNPEQFLELEAKKEIINQALSSLEPREKEIIQYRYGLIDGKVYTLEQIGKKFNLTKERIRQIEDGALRKLRNPLRANILKEIF